MTHLRAWILLRSLSLYPENSLYWWVQMKLKSAPMLLIKARCRPRTSAVRSHFVQFWNGSIRPSCTVACLLWVGCFFPIDCPHCLTFQLCIIFPLWRCTSMGFSVCTVNDLFGQCNQRSGSRRPSSHCVGMHVCAYSISALFCPDWLLRRNIYLL